MWQTHYLAFLAMLMIHGIQAHKSFRIASMARAFDVNDTSEEVLGGPFHKCYRTCVSGESHTCVYNLTLVEYTTMNRLCGNCPYTREDCFNTGCITAGGDVRPITVANHALPGPSIQVCEGDTVVVNVINTLASDSSTIHWHGMYQHDTVFMDGVPFLTQCPIHPHNTFQYKFKAEPSGSHIWHGHSGHQEADGLFGAFIVRKAYDPLAGYYDFDLPGHIIAVWHWFPTGSAFALNSALHRSETVLGYSFIVNGLGAKVQFEQDGINYTTPRAEYTVAQGSRYRFRLMYNSAPYCPIQVSIDNHTLLVIASESGTFEPVEADTMMINAGERYDFVLSANQAVGSYWMRFRGLGNCYRPELGITVSGEAILRYEGADSSDPAGSIEYDDAYRSGVLFNPVHIVDDDYEDHTLIQLMDLNSTTSDQPDISGTPDHTFYMEININSHPEFHSPGPYPQMNNLSFEFPPISLLTQSDEITDDMFCTEEDDSAKDCVGSYCTCPLIYSVATNSLVELVVIDTGTVRINDHPMHLHGYHFQVVAKETIGQNVSVADIKSRNEEGSIEKKLVGAPVKDNVDVPAHGFTILRFIAENPGYWFFHCHISSHSEMGMGVVIKVGEHSEMIQPVDSFPTCGNWDLTKVSPKSSSYSFMHDSSVIRSIFTLNLAVFATAYARYFTS